MLRRKKMSRKASKKIFTRTARKVHKKNLVRSVSRGGIRL